MMRKRSISLNVAGTKEDGLFYVKFGLVQEAEGCEKMLDGRESVDALG